MPKTVLVKHVEGYGFPRHLVFRRKGKPGLGIDKASNQPGGCASVDPRSRPSNPNSVFVILGLDLSRLCHMRRYARGVDLRQQFLDALLQRTFEEIDLNDLLKTAAEPAETTDGPLRPRHIRKLLQLADQFLILPRTSLGKTSDQL